MLLSSKLYFSYGQFMVFDSSVQLPGCDWTEAHVAQGFARRESAVNFSTLLQFGYAAVGVSRGIYEPQHEYERVIAVPFRSTSGKVNVEGPEESPSERSFELLPGHYRLVAAQYVVGDDDEVVNLCFEPLVEALDRSTILVADATLNPPTPLVEIAKIAGH